MKKLLTIALLLFVLAASFSCTEENVEPSNASNEGGTSKPTGI